MKKILLDTLKSSRASLRNSTNYERSPRGFVLIPLILVCFALCQEVQSATNTPEQPQSTDTPGLPERVPATPLTALPGFNTADGDHALFNVTTGNSNSAFGWYALFADTDGSFNTAVGAAALALNNGSENTAVGTAALLFNTTGSQNTALGLLALENNTEGIQNMASGDQALISNTTGFDNTASGFIALQNNVDGSSNTAVGAAALRDNVSGSNNQAFGRGALRFSTGNDNIGIGREAGANMTTADNVISIGSPGDGTAFATSDRCFIGNIRGVTVGNGDGINVIVDSDGQLGTSNSSRRCKKDIKPMDQTSEAILALKPVTFHYKNQDTKKAENTPQFGLIAEDVAEVNPNLVVRDADGKPFTVRYDAVNAMLLNEFLKEHATVRELKKEIAALIATVKEQAAQIQKVSAHLELIEAAPLTAAHGP